MPIRAAVPNEDILYIDGATAEHPSYVDANEPTHEHYQQISATSHALHVPTIDKRRHTYTYTHNTHNHMHVYSHRSKQVCICTCIIEIMLMRTFYTHARTNTHTWKH